MHNNYKKDEKILKEIINRNIKCKNNSDKLKIVIYYKNNKTSNLVIKNNMMPRPTPLQSTNVVYKFVCDVQHCKAEYIGHTRLTLEKRLQSHHYQGSIKNHYKESHNMSVTKEKLIENTSILIKEYNYKNLIIKEALYILRHSSRINVQFQNFFNVLKLIQMRNHQVSGN